MPVFTNNKKEKRKMHGYKKPKVDWSRKKNNRNSQNKWNMDDDSLFYTPKKKRRFYNEDDDDSMADKEFEENDKDKARWNR